MFWFGIQTFTGSECVYQVCFAPSHSETMMEHMSDAQSDMAFPGTYAEPTPTYSQHNNIRYLLFPHERLKLIRGEIRMDRDNVLFTILAHPIPLHVYLSSQNSLAVYD